MTHEPERQEADTGSRVKVWRGSSFPREFFFFITFNYISITLV